MKTMRMRATGAVVAVLAALSPVLPAKALAVPLAAAGPAFSPPPVTQSQPLRIVSWFTTVADSAGNTWEPDASYAIGGAIPPATSSSISGTSSQALYKHARIGGSGYSIPVQDPGTYFVDIYSAEIQGAQPGARRWDVTAEGQRAATAIDVAHTAGQNRAWHVMFSVRVTDGSLDLTLVPRKGQPLVTALEVDYESSATAPQNVLDDEFNGGYGQPPKPSIWTHNVGGKGWGNGMREYDTARIKNSALDGNGHLNIVARREAYTGTDGIARNWTSARLTTADHFTFEYGTASARIRVPSGTGLWPAFWGLGANFQQVKWPECGEMDVLETRGKNPNFVYGALHALRQQSDTWTKAEKLLQPQPLSRGFHVYGLVWGPSGIALSFDHRTFLTFSTADVAAGNHWNFDHPFYLLLDLAVGGRWAGAPDKTTPNVNVMSIDYVRVSA